MIWFIFIPAVVILLGIDLLVFGQKSPLHGNKKAGWEVAGWVSIGLAFTGVVFWLYQEGLVDNPENLTPGKAAIDYITGYLIELSLSVDNLFVIASLFTMFGIAPAHQHKALFWGILGAIVFRGLLISVGIVLINNLHWLTYVLGAFLLITAFNMIRKGKEEEGQKVPGWLQIILKISTTYQGEKFWVVENGVRMATPLFACLIMIEVSDVLFALDSIPAIFAVTTDPFLVFSSNIFAILGLRSMYFFLANMLNRFRYLKYSVFSILVFIGIKLMTKDFVELPEWFSLLFIGVSLLFGILISISKKEDSSGEEA